MAGTVHYNLEHTQVMSLVGTGNDWLAIAGSVSISPSITSNISRLQADGQSKYPVADAPEGSFSGEFAEADFAVLAVINGGEASTSGTPGSDAIERYVQPGRAVMAPFALFGFAPNINAGVTDAAFAVTLPRAIASPAVPQLQQQTHGTWSFDGAMEADENDAMIIYERYEVAPTMTDGVYPVNLEAPTP